MKVMITSGLLFLTLYASTRIQAADPDWLPDSVGIGTGYTTDSRSGFILEADWSTPTDWRLRGRLEKGLHNRKHSLRKVRFEESFERISLGVFAEKPVSTDTSLALSIGAITFDKASSWAARPDSGAVYKLNDRYYSGTNLGQPEAKIRYNNVVPYLGVSWTSQPATKKGWAIRTEAGAMFSLNPKLRIHSDNPSNLTFLNEDLQFEADAYVERLKRNEQFLADTAIRVNLTAIYQF